MTASRRTPLSRRWKHDGYSFRRNRHQVINRTSRHHAQALAVPKIHCPSSQRCLARRAAWVRSAAWSLSRMWETWFCTVFRETPRERAICWLLAPSARRSSTSRSRVVKSSGRDGIAGPDSRSGVRARSRGGNSRAEGSAACGDGTQRRGDLVGGRALEDVAARTRGQGGKDDIVVVHHGDHQHGGARGDLGCAPSRLDAGGAGQVDVHEHHIGGGLLDGRQGLLGGAGRAGQLHVRQGGEQAGEAVAEDGMIVDDHPRPRSVSDALTAGIPSRALATGKVTCVFRLMSWFGFPRPGFCSNDRPLISASRLGASRGCPGPPRAEPPGAPLSPGRI